MEAQVPGCPWPSGPPWTLWGPLCGTNQSERQASCPGRPWWLRWRPRLSGGPLPTCLSRLCSEPNLLVRACNQLGQFLQHRETNLRYLALESMCTLASSEFSHEAVKTHIETVINALKASALCSVSLRLGGSYWWFWGPACSAQGGLLGCVGSWVALRSAPQRLCPHRPLPLGLACEQTCNKS